MTNKSSLIVLLLVLAAAIAAAQPMSGTYYIKKGVTNADTFPSFVAAANALKANGLGGNVTFLAFAGTYDEGTCYLQDIAGDTAYTTTFDKAPAQGDVVVAAPSGGAGIYIYFNCNVKIRHLTIRAQQSGNGVISYYSSGVKVEGCKLLGGYDGVYLASANYDSVVGCVLVQNLYGIYMSGSSAPRSTGNHVSNNMIVGYEYYGIYSRYNDQTEIHGNTFSGSNNAVYGRYIANWSIKGNLFKQTGNEILYLRDASNVTSDYNDLYRPAGFAIYYNRYTYSTLAAWQSTGHDLNSISADPLVCGGLNLHIRSGSPCINAGVVIPGITTDIDGDPRDLTPDIGADEYTGPRGDPMSGVYTLKQDGTGDYCSFFDAMMDVWGRGFGGDVVFDIHAGTYAEQIRCFDLGNGTNYLTFRAHAGQDGPDRVYIKSGTSYGCWLTDACRVRFTNLDFSGYSSYGAYHQTAYAASPVGCDAVTYRGCTFTSASAYGMYWESSTNDDSVVDCRFTSGSTAVYSQSQELSPSGPNVFINNFIVGSIFASYSSGNQYNYNTIYGNYGSCVSESYYTSPPAFRNNIFFSGVSSYGVVNLSGSTAPPGMLDYNCWWCPQSTVLAYINGMYYTWPELREAGYETYGLNQNPQTGGTLNLHLRDISPCINAGVSIPGITTDIDGDSRLANTPDIGADEWTGSNGEPMSGIYTVKQAGGGDFSSISEVLPTLAIRGFGGDVQFDVYEGTYTGGYDLSPIDNEEHSFAWRAYPGEDVTLDAAGSYYTWQISNKHVRIEGFDMKGASYYGVYMRNDCADGNIRNNTITAPTGIRCEQSSDDTIAGNTIAGTSASGGRGVYLSGSSSPHSSGNVVANNTITGFTGSDCRSIYAEYQDLLDIKDNQLSGSVYLRFCSYDTIANNEINVTTASGIAYESYSGSPRNNQNTIINNVVTGTPNYGIYAGYGDYFRIRNNKLAGIYGISVSGGNFDSITDNYVHCAGGSSWTSKYGIYASSDTGLVVANNMVDAANYGIYLYYTTGAKLVYNSLQCAAGSYVMGYCLYSYYQNSGLTMHDNIFKAPAAGYAACFTYGSPFPVASDNNDFWVEGGGANVIYHSTYGAMDLATWQQRSGMDLNSISADPLFKSASDGHLQPTSPCIGAGAPFAGITTDIDGNKRSVWMPPIGPCIGADEYTLPAGWAEMAELPALVGGGGWLAHKPGERYLYAARGNESGDFYRYDYITNTWSALAAIPASGNRLPFDGARGVRGGDYIYATTGNVSDGFWRYTISEDTWEPLADAPEKLHVGTDMVYVPGTPDRVYLASGQNGQFYRYDVTLDEWANLGKVPPDTGEWLCGSFLAFDGAQTIYAHRSDPAEIRAYNIGTGLWSDALAGMPGKKSKDGGCGDWYDGGIYALKGNETNEFWNWDAATQAWDPLDQFQGGAASDGADISSWGNGTFFALQGGQTARFWRYVLEPETREGVQSAVIRPQVAKMGLVAPSPLVGSVLNLRYSVVRPGPVQLTVFDILGRGVVKREFVADRTGRLAVDIGNLSAGIYLVRIDDGEQHAVRKVVVQR